MGLDCVWGGSDATWQVHYEGQLKKAVKKIDGYKGKVKAAEEEAAMLRERAFEMQAKLDEAKKSDGTTESGGSGGGAAASTAVASKGAVDTFDAEGQFQVLYKECLTALNAERDARHEVVHLLLFSPALIFNACRLKDSVRARTEVQNLKEALEDAKEELVSMRADIEVRKLRESSLAEMYATELRILREKEAQYVEELKRLKEALDKNELQERIASLEAQLEEAKQMTGGELVEQEKQRHEREMAIVMEKNMKVMEEVYVLKERAADFEYLREKCFFALVWVLKVRRSVEEAA